METDTLIMRSFDMATVCGAKGSGKSILEKVMLRNYRSVFVFDTLNEFPEFPHYVPKTNNPAELDAVCNTLYKKGNIMLLVSEAELYLPVVPVMLPEHVMEIASRGRHRNVGMLLDTRRIAMLNKTAFSLCEFQFIFRHWSPNDLDYLKGFLPKGTTDKIATLPDYYFLVNHRGQVTYHNPLPENLIKDLKRNAK